MRIFILIVCSVFMVACASNKQVQPVNVMIAVDDSGADAVPADFNSVKSLVSKVSNELNQAGINVYDETSLTLDDFSFSRGQRNKAALLDMARSIKQVKLDYVVILTAEANVRSKAHTQAVTTHVVGSVINVHSGRVVGSFAENGSAENANVDCSRRCLNDIIGDSLSASAGDVGATIVSKLPIASAKQVQNKSKRKVTSSSSQDWVLTFDGFSQQDMLQIEEYLPIFSGYENMRYISSTHTYAEIWYTSSISSAKLNRNLKRMFSEINERAMISQEGNRIEARKITLRGKENTKFDLDGW